MMGDAGFAAGFPKTKAALEAARGDVFPAYAAGVSLAGRRQTMVGGCAEQSLFDLASLTKVVCTTTLAALAHQNGRLSPDAEVKRFFPAFPDARVRLSHLLEHSSGLPWWLPLHAHFHEPDGPGRFDAKTTPALARAYFEAEILKSHRPGEFEKRAEYSDLGFLLLGWALEKVLGAPLDSLFRDQVAAPLKLGSLMFHPLTETSPENIMPTEDCPWRRKILRGEVHDDNCYVLGGVAAHAGVFGHVSDTLSFGETWLKAFLGQDESILKQDTARRFWTASKIPGSTRALGWDGVSPQGSSTGRFFSPSTRGHLGFTGTSLWIDPEKELVVVLLTNRVHPSRANEKIRNFRPLFHDTLLTELGLG